MLFPWPHGGPRPGSLRHRRSRRLGIALAVAMAWSAVPGAATAGGDLQGFDEPGPYQVARLDVEVPRPSGGGASFDARLYYPLPAESEGAPEVSPVVAFGHGYQASVDRYEATLAHLASWGIVTIAPRSGGELFPSHQAFADDLRAALDWVATAAADGSTWPGGPVDASARGVAGHSMGGGAALLAAADDPTIRAVATLAAAETDPSAIEAAAGIEAPTLFLAGSDDAITPVDEHQRPMFEATSSGQAQLRTIIGGSHCGFLDSETILLGLVCDDGAIAPEDHRAMTRAILAGWLRYELLADESASAVAWPDGPDGWTVVESR